MRTEHHEVNGDRIMVIHLNDEPHECNMCGAVGFHNHCVPWYCGPVLEGDSEGGYKTVCKACHNKWATWNDSMQGQSV